MRLLRRRGPRARASAAALALGVLATLALGCAADLPEGVFDCTTGDCPDGWSCFPDNRCYSSSFTGLELYAPCDVDEDCASGVCVRAYDASATFGQCSQACTSSATCGVGDVCAPMGVGCLEGCSNPSECAAAQSCVVAPGSPGTTVCAEFVSPDFSGRKPCGGPGDCEPGSMCMRAAALDNMGVCVWPCSPGGSCPLDATCEAIPTSIASVGENPDHACMSPCVDVPNSCGSPALSCAPFPNASRHCAPTGWLP